MNAARMLQNSPLPVFLAPQGAGRTKRPTSLETTDVKRLILLALWAAALTAVMGCGEAPEKKAADRIAEQADVARRMYLNAVGIPMDPNRIADRTGSIEAALAMLDNAARVANKAIADNSAATMIGKTPAYRIGAEINRQKAMCYSRLASFQVEEAQRLCRRAELNAFTLADLGHQADFYRDLSSLDVTQVQALLTAARQELQQSQAARKTLVENQQAVEKQIADAMAALEPLAPQARQFRQQAKATKGLESLEVLTRAEQIERQADVHEARLNQLKLQLEQVVAQEKIADVSIEGVSSRVRALEGCLKDIANRGAIVAAHQQELTSSTSAITAATNALVKELTGKFTAAMDLDANAVEAYDKARTANKSVLSGLSKLSSEAKAAQTPGPSVPGGPTLLSTMAAQSGKLPAVSAEAELALAAADTRRGMLELVSQMAALQARLAAAAASAKVSLGGELAQAVAQVAELPAKAEQAKADYMTAQQEFETAGNLANGAREIKGSAWVYQLQRVQAYVGLYLLSKQQGQPDAQALTEARVQLASIRKAFEEEKRPMTVDMASIEVMDRALQQIQ